jgi:peptidoglycan/LPS O-acetylase OafA/YrhL
VEAFFYTMFPVLGRIFKRLNASKLVIIGVTCWVAGLAVPLWYLVQNPDRVGYGSAEMKVFWLDAIKFNPLVRLPEFVIGMIAGRFFLMKKRLGGMSPGWHSFLGVVVVSAVLAGSSLIPYPLLHNGLLAPVYAYFIFALAHGEGRIAQFLATPVLVLLGEASYSLYLLHLPIARWMLKGAHTIGVNTSTILYFCVYTIVAIGMSIVVLKLVEEPARRFIRSRFQRRKSAAGQKAVV